MITHLFFLLLLFLPTLLPAETDQENLKKTMQLYHQLTQKFDSQSISAKNLLEKINNKEKIVIVDVREEKERKVSSLPNAISKEEFVKNQDKFKASTIVVYCTIGYRSGEFCTKLNNKNAYNLAGGVLAWSHAGGEFFRNGEKTSEVHTYSKDWNFLHSNYKAIFE